MAREKDRLHEKHQLILADMLRDEANKYCADCNAKGPRWASWNLGIFVCIRCAGLHRHLGVHLSRVKSVNLDSWTPEQIESMRSKGNRKAKEVYEATLPEGFRRPQDDYAVESFIRAKYEKKIYMSKGAVNKEPVKTNKPLVAKEQEAKRSPKRPQQANLTAATHTRSKSDPPQSIQKPKPVPKAVSQRASPAPPATNKAVDLLTDQPLLASPATRPEPLLGEVPKPQATTAVKDSIMSLYNVQPGYNAQGYAVNSYYQQQQAAAAMMMHQQQQMHSQVLAVQQQMARLHMHQPPHPQQPQGQPAFAANNMGGQTLNPQLW